jgi:hypothetical protein
MPFPGAIYFVNPSSSHFKEAVELFLSFFNSTAPRSGASVTRKGFSARYASSLVAIVNNKLTDKATALSMLQSDDLIKEGIVVEFINIAPHAATIEVADRIMYEAAAVTSGKYSPGVTVTYDYINSDQLKAKYGRGTGGPGQARARATGRAYPVVYALPRVQIALNATQFNVSNVRFVLPGRKVSYRRLKRLRGTGRQRS